MQATLSTLIFRSTNRKKYLTDSNESLIWSTSSNDHGDLRARAGVCACDSCNDVEGTYYECELLEETGAVLKWYMTPSNTEECANQEMSVDARERAHTDIQETFYVTLGAGQPIAYPLLVENDTAENERPYFYLIAGTCAY